MRNIQNLYYKEGDECRSKKKFIDRYFELDGPATYLDKECRVLHCRDGYARSSNDLFSLLKTQFKTTTKSEMTRILLENDSIGMVLCDNVKDFTFWNLEYADKHGREFYPNEREDLNDIPDYFKFADMEEYEDEDGDNEYEYVKKSKVCLRTVLKFI